MKKIIIPFFCAVLYTAPVAAQTTTAPAKTEAVKSKLTPKEVIDNYLKALGGKDKLEGIKTTLIENTLTVQGMDVMRTKKKSKVIDALPYDPASFSTVTIEKIDGKDYNVLTSDKGKFYFDASTGLLYKSSAEEGTAIVKSYMTVDGLKFPQEIEAEGNGQKVVIKTTKITLNSGVSDADFK